MYKEIGGVIGSINNSNESLYLLEDQFHKWYKL